MSLFPVKRLLICAVALLASAGSIFAQGIEQVVDRAIRASAILKPLSPLGTNMNTEAAKVTLKESWQTISTAWLVDAKRKLMLTAAHCVVEYTHCSDHGRIKGHRAVYRDRMQVVFPLVESGKLEFAKDFYQRNLGGAELNKFKNSDHFSIARVVDVDLRRDLALLEVDHFPPGTPQLPLAEIPGKPGDPYIAVGHPFNASKFWSVRNGVVQERSRQHWCATSFEGATFNYDALVLVQAGNTKPGSSGGATVNGAGEVIGLVSAGQGGIEKFGFDIDVTEIRSFLRDAIARLEASAPLDVQRRGRRNLALGRLALAASDFREVHARRAEIPDILDDDLLDLAAVAREQHDFARSLEFCDQALAQSQRRPGRAYAERAATRLAQLPEAAFVAVADKGPLWVSALDPLRDDPTHQLEIEKEQKRRDAIWGPRRQAVLADVAAALRENPKTVLALRTRADLLRRLPKPDHQQILADRTAIVALTNNLLNRDPLSLVERARAYVENQQLDLAIADCRAACKIDPRSAVAVYWLARCLHAAKKPEAWEESQRLVADLSQKSQAGLESTNPVNLELNAVICFDRGEFADAAGLIDVAIDTTKKLKLSPQRWHRVFRGEANLAQGKHEAAIDDFTAALKIADPICQQPADCDAAEAHKLRFADAAIKRRLAAAYQKLEKSRAEAQPAGR